MSIPKLRFNEFNGSWTTKKIDEIAIVTSGGTPSRNVAKYWNGHIPWVTTSLVNFNIISNAEEFITQEGVDNSSAKLFPKNTILMAMYGQGITRGKVAILNIEATTNQACAAIKLKDGLNTHFVFQNLMNRYEEIRDLSNEGGQKNLSAGIIKDILISFPSKLEQTKIASFLSSVDEKIAQLTQKHELLSEYKQGMMQKIFSQQIRFKARDGSEFGEWIKVRLKDILISYRLGGNYSNSEFKTSYPLIKMGNLSRGSINLDKIEYIPNDEKIDKEDLIKTNDLFFNTRNTLDLVDKVAIWKDELPQAYYNSNLMRLEFENNIFMNYLFNEQSTLEKLKSIASGTTSVAAIYTKDLLKINLEIPCLEEQTKIANFLSVIDQKIEVVAQQIEQAKQWKKGLLQQMFV